MKIEQLRGDDIPAIYALQCRSFKPEFHEPLSLFHEMFGHYPQGCFAMYDAQTLAGYIFLHPSDDDRTDYESAGWARRGDEACLFIHDLCIDPSFQGRGFSQMAVAHIHAFAKTHNFQKIIGIAIQGVEDFWKKQGFKMVKPYTYCGEPATFMEKPVL